MSEQMPTLVLRLQHCFQVLRLRHDGQANFSRARPQTERIQRIKPLHPRASPVAKVLAPSALFAARARGTRRAQGAVRLAPVGFADCRGARRIDSVCFAGQALRQGVPVRYAASRSVRCNAHARIAPTVSLWPVSVVTRA
jgi:hypothetical protein